LHDDVYVPAAPWAPRRQSEWQLTYAKEALAETFTLDKLTAPDTVLSGESPIVIVFRAIAEVVDLVGGPARAAYHLGRALSARLRGD
jgi:hypothetical protein